MTTRKLVTRRKLAELFAVHMQTVTKWEQEGMPIAVRGSRGRPTKYSESDVKEWLQAREEAAEQGLMLDPVQERARRERAQAILAEQTVAIRARELVPRAEVEKAWGAEVSAVRAKLLSWPATLSDRLYREGKLNGVSGIERTLKEAVYDLLLELTGGVPQTKTKATRKK